MFKQMIQYRKHPLQAQKINRQKRKNGKVFDSAGLGGRILHMMLLLTGYIQTSMAQPALKAQEVWPSIDAYYRINPKFRLYGTVGGSKLSESNYTDGNIGAFLDLFTFPFTHIHRSNSPEDLPGKFLWMRAGYQYSASPPSSEDPFKESMIVTELNGRFYLPYKILLTFKNRFDWRVNNGDFNARYRPKLMFEKDLRTEFLYFTANGFAEYFFNFGNSTVNRLRTQIGIEFRVTKMINYEVFWNHQFTNAPEIQKVDAFGMTLKIYLDRKELKEKINRMKIKKNDKHTPSTNTGSKKSNT
jgi:hypothetical protein